VYVNEFCRTIRHELLVSYSYSPVVVDVGSSNSYLCLSDIKIRQCLHVGNPTAKYWCCYRVPEV